LVASIGDPRVRIIDAVWDESRRHHAYSDHTNVALGACTGDWCLYIQADEVLHEDDHEGLGARCTELLDDRRVDGMLFDYLHFFGDYSHVQQGQGWYSREIRLIRNRAGIRSVRDAQSFRRPPQRRLAVARSGARIFHYGWVRHPRLMQDKVRAFWSHRVGGIEAEARVAGAAEFDYGPLARLRRWQGAHPRVMAERMAAMDWGERLRETDPPGGMDRPRHRDERLLYRFLTALSRTTRIDLNHKNHGRVLDV
jgi:hypothetical protein